MSDVKWIKICTDIFDDEKILLIESLPEADSIIVIWFKLLTLAGKKNNGGVFVINDSMPYTDEMFATIFRRKKATVQLALSTFRKFGMIDIIDNAVTIPKWNEHQSLDQYEAKKQYMKQYMAEKRAKEKALKEGCKTNCKTNSKVNSEVNSKTNSEFNNEVNSEVNVTECKANVSRLDKIRLDKIRLDKSRGSNTTTSDTDLSQIYQQFEAGIGCLNQTLAGKLEGLYEDFGYTALSKAIDRAVEANARNIDYIRATARNIAEGKEFKKKESAGSLLDAYKELYCEEEGD